MSLMSQIYEILMKKVSHFNFFSPPPPQRLGDAGAAIERKGTLGNPKASCLLSDVVDRSACSVGI